MRISDQINGNIIRMNATGAHRANYPAIIQLEAYWDALRSKTGLPKRGDIDPRGLDSALEFTFILERIAPGVGRFRVAGQHLNDLMGLDVNGMPISAMMVPEARVEFGRLIERVCVDPCLCEVWITAPPGFGRGELQGKILLAPLLDDHGQVTRIIGCLQTSGTIGRQPRRFRVTEVSNRIIEDVTFSNTGRPKSQAEPAEFAFREPREPYVAKPAPGPHQTDIDQPKTSDAPAQGTLRLVVNNG